MRLFNLLRFYLPPARPQRARRATPQTRLWVEPLEERALLDAALGSALGNLPGPIVSPGPVIGTPPSNPGLPVSPPVGSPGPGTPGDPGLAAFVTQLYHDLLYREPAAAEVSGWVSLLQGRESPLQVAGQVASSAERQTLIIQADYRAYLGRDGTPTEVGSWLRLTQAGLNDDQLAAGFLGSDEFYLQHGGTDSGWVAGLYGVALGRAPDADGMTGWLYALQAGVPRYQVALQVLQSTEAHAVTVGDVYGALLHRSPDPGASTWVAQLDAGVPAEQVMAGVAASPEFFNDALASAPLEPTSISLLGINPDQGVSSSDGLTDQPDLAAQGFGTPATPFMIYVDGVPTTRGRTGPGGQFQVGLASPLGEGNHLLSARPVDGSAAAGSPSTYPVSIDLTAPTVTLQAPVATETTTPTVTVTASDNDGYGLASQVAIDVDLKNDGSFTDPGDLNFATAYLAPGSTTVTLNPLPPGTYRLRARVMDRAGNVGVSPVQTMEIGLDTRNPMPLSFEVNQGQTDPQVNFLAHGTDYEAFLVPSGLVLSLPAGAASPANPAGAAPGPSGSAANLIDAFQLKFDGANPSPQGAGQDALPGKVNYLIGNDPSFWHTNVPTYAQVRYQDLYPGVDLTYHSDQGNLEFALTVAPGADPTPIAFNLAASGTQTPTPTLGADGGLTLTFADGQSVTLGAPAAYQDTPGGRRAVSARYVLAGGSTVGFALGSYDPTLPLVIDPTLAFSTYLNGTMSTVAFAIAVDATGNSYVTGNTNATDFPVSAGAFQGTNKITSGVTAFVTKFDATGALAYSTYLGGSKTDRGYGIAVDKTGDAVVVGDATSTDFPVTPGAFQPKHAGGIDDAFVTKLNATGSALVYSTYLGGSGVDYANGVALDAGGNAYVTGPGQSSDFPTTPGTVEPSTQFLHASFLTKFNPTGGVVYSTYVCGTTNENITFAVAVDAAGDAYLTGDTNNTTDFPVTPGAAQTTIKGAKDAFVLKLNPTASQYLYATLIGGTGDDFGYGIAVDGTGAAYVTGNTQSKDWPVTPGAFQTTYKSTAAGVVGGEAFVTKVSPDGKQFVYSTFLGGTGSQFGGEQGQAIAVDSTGDAYVIGTTGSNDFPVVNPIQATNKGAGDAFLTVLNPYGTGAVLSTYLGGINPDNGRGIALDGQNAIYGDGFTRSNDFPTTSGAFQPTNPSIVGPDSAFVFKVGAVVAPGTPGPGTPTVPPVPTGPGGGNVSFQGDIFEPNDTSDRAVNFGVLTAGAATLDDLSIANHPNGLPDYDWFRWTMGQAGVLTATVTITASSGDLELHLFTLHGNTLVELGQSSSPGATTLSLAEAVSAGEPILVEIKGAPAAPGLFGQGNYNLVLNLM